MYFVYILYSATLDKYYIGSSYNVQQRLDRHNRGHSNFTKSGIPWIVVYTEEFPDRKSAYGREMFIKGKKSKTYIEELIRSIS